jgi:hypothetical protein
MQHRVLLTDLTFKQSNRNYKAASSTWPSCVRELGLTAGTSCAAPSPAPPRTTPRPRPPAPAPPSGSPVSRALPPPPSSPTHGEASRRRFRALLTILLSHKVPDLCVTVEHCAECCGRMPPGQRFLDETRPTLAPSFQNCQWAHVATRPKHRRGEPP